MEKLTAVHIYSLSCPKTGEVGYIGQSRNVSKRLEKHLCTKTTSRVSQWVNSLKNAGLKPVIEIVESVTENDYQYWEIFYISLFRSWGFNLRNISLGGAGVTRLPNDKQLNVKPNKPVFLFDLAGALINHFVSVKEASKSLGCKQSQVSRALKKGGMINRLLVSETDNVILPTYSYREPILLVDEYGKTLSEYTSARDAAKKLSLKSPHFIHKVCKGVYSNYLGLKFKYKSSVYLAIEK